jgi:hypothetical protein
MIVSPLNGISCGVEPKDLLLFHRRSFLSAGDRLMLSRIPFTNCAIRGEYFFAISGLR